MVDRSEESAAAPEEFEAFYSVWLKEQQRFLDRLILVSNQNDATAKQNCVDQEQSTRFLVQEILSHYMRYYEEKAKAMARDKYLFFISPSTLSSLEKVFLWMGGFKPSSALNLLEATVTDMSPEQKSKIEQVRKEAEAEEKAVEGAKGPMWAVIRQADKVRWETVRKAMESLTGGQTVKFLVAAGSYQLGMRSLGINFPW